MPPVAWDDINPSTADDTDRTPLWWAARFGHDGVARLLLTRDDIHPNEPNNQGETPLWQLLLVDMRVLLDYYLHVTISIPTSQTLIVKRHYCRLCLLMAMMVLFDYCLHAKMSIWISRTFLAQHH
ncbi:hypothetical protein L873DRAFT_1803909, partial [Choiromyces venosus 120613-1]